MRIVVPMKSVPDLVEEIELTADGTGIEREQLKFVLNEWDAQALEEALLLKDSAGAEVVAVGCAVDPEIDQILYTALAKGADAAVRLADARAGSPLGPAGIPVAARAALLAAYLEDQPADLVISGVQAPDDPDGQLPPTLAALLGLPHVSVVVAVEAEGDGVTVRQEFAGGRSHELWVGLPAVIGVQSARQAPRYAPISRITPDDCRRRPRRAGGVAAGNPDGPVPRRMLQPETTGRAEMLAGSPGDVAEQIVELLRPAAS